MVLLMASCASDDMQQRGAQMEDKCTTCARQPSQSDMTSARDAGAARAGHERRHRWLQLHSLLVSFQLSSSPRHIKSNHERHRVWQANQRGPSSLSQCCCRLRLHPPAPALASPRRPVAASCKPAEAVQQRRRCRPPSPACARSPSCRRPPPTDLCVLALLCLAAHQRGCWSCCAAGVRHLGGN